MDNNKPITIKEYDLGYGYTIREGNEYYALFKDGGPKKTLNIERTNVYNRIFDFKPRAKSISMKKDKIVIDFVVETKRYKKHDFSDFFVTIGYKEYNITKKSKTWQVEVPYDSISIPGRITGVYLAYKDENGFMFKKKFLIMRSFKRRLRNKYLTITKTYNKYVHHDLYYSELVKHGHRSIYLYETWNGYLSLAYREINATDNPKEAKKINAAFKKYQKDFEDEKNVPSVLLYEKFCGKYEESAKYVYERLIDDGCENVFFILNKDSEYWNEIPDKYKANVIEKYSPKHYYEYFNAKAFITTETMNHVIDLTTYNPLTRRRQYWKDYYYIFLQHGIMYAYSLRGRGDFVKGKGFDKNSYVVVSSQTEANHFIEDGRYDMEDLIKCGLPKLDYAVQNEDADKILIMPTSRNFEYSTIRDDTENSTYYNFSKQLINSVPEELKDKIVFIPHPLVKAIFGKTDLEEYMAEEHSYDELLKDTRLLITDYSSISYDAFYRGANVIFAWMEKEMCLERLRIELKLNDDNAFADIAYDYDTLTELITKNYYGEQSNENIEKFRDIVEFNDGNNTERFIEYLYNTNIFPEKADKRDINDATVSGIEERAYTGKKLGTPKIKVSYNGVKLIRNMDYKVKNSNNIEVGTATCEIQGMGIYTGTKTEHFEIKKNIRKTEYDIEEGELVLSSDDYTLIKEKDYVYEWFEYPDLGLDRIVIEGIGEYSGKKTILIDKLAEDEDTSENDK